MEIREFCEQVLFSTRLEDKLARPDLFEDEHPGAALGAVAQPGRPVGLEIDFNRTRVEFPALHELDQAEAHGRALHFFANHELLAIELMAVALMRFPTAPAAFRLGLARIIREEQVHFELYRDRAAELGVEIGRYPLNGFFWSCLSGVGSPVDAVAALSLTLEQANLDYAAYYARAFRRVGADKSAAILERVLEDEIGHVAHGLHWFREWVGSDEELFEAHAARLQLPLSMRRARGVGFEIEPRRKVGFPDDYIARVEAFRGSKGRPPVVYSFNPDCEEEVLTGVETQPHGIAQNLQRDLETLPVFLASPEDIVLVHETPSERFVSDLEAAGIRIPRFLTEVPSEAEDPHLGDLRPWGWSPVAQGRLRDLFGRVVAGPRFFETWSIALTRIHSKSVALPVLRSVLERCDEAWLASNDEIGTRADDLDSVTDLVSDWNAGGYHECVIKAEFGSSGRNMLRIRDATIEPTQRRFIERALVRHGAVVVEPWLDRVCDISLRMNIDAPGEGRVVHVGRFLADRRGQYIGGFTGHVSRALPAELRRWASGEGRDRDRIMRVMNVVAGEVTQALKESAYVGPVGVDALIYRDRDHELRLKPVVEMNPRTTMGHVCVALEDSIVDGRAGLWAVLSIAELAKGGLDNPAAFAEFLRRRHPIQTAGGRIDSGALATTDPWTARSFLTVLFVAKNHADLASMIPTWSSASRVLSP